MIELGYEPCSEEPWTDRQGQSSFVWSMLDPIAQVTERITIDTAVTCPNIRIHPAIAQAARRQLLSGRNRYLDKLRKYEEVECSRVYSFNRSDPINLGFFASASANCCRDWRYHAQGIRPLALAEPNTHYLIRSNR